MLEKQILFLVWTGANKRLALEYLLHFTLLNLCVSRSRSQRDFKMTVTASSSCRNTSLVADRHDSINSELPDINPYVLRM
jgi:hypothetical protein